MGRAHGENLLKTGKAEVISVCDVSEHNADALASDLKAVAYTDFDKMLDKEPFDVLYICLPPFAHSGQFEKAAARGIHIFIEKPIALDTKRGENMCNAARVAGIHTMVGFHMRHGSAVARLKSVIDSGEAGRPVLFSGKYQCNSLHTPWWIDVEKSGGQIFEQAIHLYDMCRYLIGDPQTTCAFMGNVLHSEVSGYTVEDVCTSISDFEIGALASITSNNCSIPDRWDALFEITFENLVAVFRDPDNATFFYKHPERCEEKTFNTTVDHKLVETQVFLDIILGNKEPVCDIWEGLRSLSFVDTVAKSAKLNGKKMQITKY